MENEGIMGLPQGQSVQNQGSANQPIYVSSADTYDAALTALGTSTNDPAQAEAVRQAVRESIADLELSPTELASLLEILEYMSQNPKEYPQIRQRLIDMDLMDPDDLPEAYDPAYLGMAIMALNEYQAEKAKGAQAPMEMAPVVQGMEPMAMAEGGLADMAKYLAAKGRNGDSILAHITPSEARLLKSMGGSGTINPETGLPEFFLKKLFKGIKKAVKSLLKNPIVRVVATVALATVLGPAAASVVGTATGTAAGVALSTAATAASTALASTAAGAAISAMAGEKINVKSLLINAATSYFGAGGSIAGYNPVSSLANVAGRLPGVVPGGAVAQGIGAGLTSAGIGALAGMKGQDALTLGLQSGIMTGLQAARAPKPPVEAPTPPTQQVQTPPAGAPSGLMAGEGTVAQGQWSPYEGAPAAATAPPGAAPVAGAAPTTTPAVSAVPYRSSSAYGISEIMPTAPSTGAPTTAPTAMPSTAAAAPTTFMGRVGDFFKTPSMESFTNAFLVNPSAEKGTLARYAPGVATALTVAGATGGFKAGEAEEDPLFKREYTGREFIRDNPQMFQGGLEPTKLTPYNPVVDIPTYFTPPGSRTTGPALSAPYTAPVMPVSQPSMYLPPANTMTNMPGGIPQPYNVSGLYGVPLLYGNPAQPVRPPGYAEGGDVDKEDLLDMIARKIRGESLPTRGGPTSREPTGPSSPQVTYLPNPFGKSIRVVLGPSGAGMPRKELYSPVVMDENLRTIANPNYRPENDPEVQRILREFDKIAEERKKKREPVKKAMGGPVNNMLRQATSNPANVARTEAMLFAGPQAAQQAGMAVQALDRGGIMGLKKGGQPTHFPRKTGPINGPGTGTSDSIPAMLSDGEFVFTAKAVRSAGGGSRRKGARRMYKLMKMLEGGNVKG